MLLALVLAASPVDVEQLSLEELLIEQARLESTPTTAAPWTTVGVGLGLATLCFATFGVAEWQLGELRRRSSSSRAFITPAAYASSVQVVALVHGVMAVATLLTGVLWLPSRATEVEEAELLRPRVRERIAELTASGATYDEGRVRARRWEHYTAAEPSYALPANLMVGGAVSLLSGLVTFGVFYREGGVSAMAAGAAETIAGVGLIAVASWLLYRYASERDWLRSRPPPASADDLGLGAAGRPR